MIGSRRNDSSTIRAIPSAIGEARSSRNFSNSSSARSDEETRAETAAEAAVAAVASVGIAAAPSLETVVVSKISSGTPRAREILVKVPA